MVPLKFKGVMVYLIAPVSSSTILQKRQPQQNFFAGCGFGGECTFQVTFLHVQFTAEAGNLAFGQINCSPSNTISIIVQLAAFNTLAKYSG
jgi:hypothetical protein